MHGFAAGFLPPDLAGKQAIPFLKGGIAQVGLLVADLDSAVANYWRHFGIGPWHFYTYGTGLCSRMTYHGQPVQYRMRLALSYVGSLRIELIQPLEGPTVYADFVREHGFGLHHWGLLVDDMAVALAQAEAAGWPMLMDGGGFGLDGDGDYAYLDTESEIGVLLELIERPKRRLPPEKVYPPEAAA